MIKVRVGQVWEGSKTACKWQVNWISDDGLIHYGQGNYVATPIPKIEFVNCFKFVPQNDLEKLAVNETEWFHSDCSYVKLDEYNHPMYVSNIDLTCNRDHKYTHRSEWQNMRYHLGLDTKPHYRFINGQWSETK